MLDPVLLRCFLALAVRQRHWYNRTTCERLCIRNYPQVLKSLVYLTKKERMWNTLIGRPSAPRQVVTAQAYGLISDTPRLGILHIMATASLRVQQARATAM